MRPNSVRFSEAFHRTVLHNVAPMESPVSALRQKQASCESLLLDTWLTSVFSRTTAAKSGPSLKVSFWRFRPSLMSRSTLALERRLLRFRFGDRPEPGDERLTRSRWIARLLLVAGAAMMAVPDITFAADVRVMISAGFYQAYAELGPAFERLSGYHLITTRGPSMATRPKPSQPALRMVKPRTL